MDLRDRLVFIGKIEALEKRIEKLEAAARLEGAGGKAENLLRRYPFVIRKKEAAAAIGVTRCTVYNMIRDGRLKTNADGKILTRSVIDYIERGSR